MAFGSSAADWPNGCAEVPPNISPKRALIRGAAWTIGTRWSVRALGFGNTMVMARLLIPSDYGLVAIGMLLYGVLQAFIENGAAVALLRKDAVTEQEINAAWTLRLIQCVVAGVALAVVAPFAALYFDEPKIRDIVWLLAGCMLMPGLANIGMTLAQKEYNYTLEFKSGIICKLVGILVGIAAGYVLRDYRALLLSLAAGFICGLVLSYTLHPYRPRWDTRQIRQTWDFSKWLMLSGFGGFVLHKADELIAARVGSTADFGLYNVGASLGQMPTGEVGPAMLKALMPVLASLQLSPAQMKATALKTMAVLNSITLPIGLGFAALAVPATEFILGPAWRGASGFVAGFALVSTLQIVLQPLATLLVTMGHSKVQSRIVFIEFGGFVVAALLLTPLLGLPGLVFARILAALVSLTATGLSARRHCGVPLTAAALTFWRPLAGACLMGVGVHTLCSWEQSLPMLLFTGVSAGVLFYTLWMYLSWHWLGRPDGLEATIVANAPQLVPAFLR